MENFIELLKCLETEHEKASLEWQNKNTVKTINTKKILVSDVFENKSHLDPIFRYKMFLDKHIIDSLIALIKQFEFRFETRVKTQNSIESKIAKYTNNKNEGKIPLKKCLNDLLGVRIILENCITFKEIFNLINKKNIPVKCIDSNKDEYNATHVYFKTESNYDFQWELQIWDKTHEQANRESHRKYKQGYTKWEAGEKE